jgi:hypothetical protein
MKLKFNIRRAEELKFQYIARHQLRVPGSKFWRTRLGHRRPASARDTQLAGKEKKKEKKKKRKGKGSSRRENPWFLYFSPPPVDKLEQGVNPSLK